MRMVQHVMREGEGQALCLAPLGDIQWNGRAEQVSDRLEGHIKRAVALNAYYVGLGDYVDFMSPSNRERLMNGNLYDNAMQAISDKAKALVEEVYERYLQATKGRWLGLVSGHHLFPYYDETEREHADTDAHLAYLLGDAPHAECLMYLRLLFFHKGKTGQYDIWMHHGCGSGLPASVYNRLVKQAQHWPADLFLMGHTTSRFARPIPRLGVEFDMDEARLTDKEVWLVSTGGWSRAYGQGRRADYVEKGMMPPVSIGAPLITIIPQWDGDRFNPTVRVEA